MFQALGSSVNSVLTSIRIASTSIGVSRILSVSTSAIRSATGWLSTLPRDAKQNLIKLCNFSVKYAAAHNYSGITKLFLKLNSITNASLTAAFYHAIQHENHPLARILASKAADRGVISTLLQDAVTAQHANAIAFLRTYATTEELFNQAYLFYLGNNIAHMRTIMQNLTPDQLKNLCVMNCRDETHAQRAFLINYISGNRTSEIKKNVFSSALTDLLTQTQNAALANNLVNDLPLEDYRQLLYYCADNRRSYSTALEFLIQRSTYQDLENEFFEATESVRGVLLDRCNPETQRRLLIEAVRRGNATIVRIFSGLSSIDLLTVQAIQEISLHTSTAPHLSGVIEGITSQVQHRLANQARDSS